MKEIKSEITYGVKIWRDYQRVMLDITPWNIPWYVRFFQYFIIFAFISFAVFAVLDGGVEYLAGTLVLLFVLLVL